jgi:predicted enzyme related to lactoylglutathione lyase
MEKSMKAIINIDVPDLSTAIEFYTEAIGLIHSRTIDEDVAELIGASSIIYLLQKSANSSASSKSLVIRNYARHWTPVHLDFVVDNINSAKEKALQAGAVCESECIEWMGSKCVTFSDPFGHGFCLIEFTNETYQEPSF